MKFFITHSWKDIEFAQRLCDDLSRNGLDGFLDAHSINPGDSIPSRIERGLKECDVYIPIFSPDALKSDWCDWEIDMAITMNRTRKGRPRIIPVIALSCDVPDRLIHLLHVNFVGRYDAALAELLTRGFGLPSQNLSTPSHLTIESSQDEQVIARDQNYRDASLKLRDASKLLERPRLVLASLAAALRAVRFAGWPRGAAVLLALALVAALGFAIILTRGSGSTKIATDGSVMVFVPAGEFSMGSSEPDKNAIPNEKPLHTVYLNAFWISKYEVTNALYKKCVDSGRCSAPGYWADGTFPSGKENHPVVDVSWNHALAYAQWMGGRLPTEAEWEKAACWDEARKAKRVYPWGNEFDPEKANTSESGIGDTTPVLRYPNGASPYGALDMAGNVFEWTSTIWGKDWDKPDFKYPYRADDGREDLQSDALRVLRGGAWEHKQDEARCASRFRGDPKYRYTYVGFRVAESVP